MSLVSACVASSPGIGGRLGAAPVASRAWVNRTGLPSTVACPGPVNSTVPCRTVAPVSSIASGESIGAMWSIAPRTCFITAGKSTSTPCTVIPRSPACRAPAAAAAAASSDLDGTQPVQRQSPPVRSRSTSSTRAPIRAAVLAPTMPAVPPPTTSRSQVVSPWWSGRFFMGGALR